MKTVLITRPLAQAKKFQDQLKGFDTIIISPMIVNDYVLSEEDQIEITEDVLDGAWCFFTSANAVSVAAPYLLGSPQIAAVGKETANELLKYGFKTSFIPEKNTGEGLSSEFFEKYGDDKDIKILLFQGDSASDFIEEFFKSKHILIKKFIVYSVNELPGEDLPLIETLTFINALEDNELVITFFSRKTIYFFEKLIPELIKLSNNAEELSKKIYTMPVVVIGEKTKEVAIKCNFKNVIETESKTSESMITTLRKLVLPC